MEENWRQREQCQPFVENGNLYIVVESAYKSPGTQKDARLSAAVYIGIDLLLKFYGKENNQDIVDGLYSVSFAIDYFVSYKPCVPMKVLVQVPKSAFDEVDTDPTACSIDFIEDGQLFKARLSLISYSEGITFSEKINFVADTLESYVPVLARSSKFMSNINFLAEIKRLRKVNNIVGRYLSLNNVVTDPRLYDPCVDEISDPLGTDSIEPHAEGTNELTPEDVLLELTYTLDYELAYALINKEQHTIGYDCFIENTILNHITTAAILVNLDGIYGFLISSGENTFDIFDFCLKYFMPQPAIQMKQKQSDGLPLYDENGVSFGFADLAKLLALELDVNLCKTRQQLAEENNKILNRSTREELRDSANRIVKTAGDYKLTSAGTQRLKDTLLSIKDADADEALRKIYDDMLAKINIGCKVNDALRCYIDRTIELVGEQIIDGDAELGQLLDTSFTLGAIVDAQCGFTRCDGSPDVDFSVGFPVFQGVKIPSNFPTTSYLSDVIDEALNKLYAALIQSLVTSILGILNNSCDVLFDDVLGEGNAANSIKDGYQEWLGKSIGINYEDLNDPEAWKDALTSAGGTGFMGAVGTAISKGVKSGIAVYEDTGVSLNVPNPENGWRVEEAFISPESVTNFFSNLQSATKDVNALTTPSEQASLYRGSASYETKKITFACLKLRNPNFSNYFENEEDFADMFSELGKIVRPELLQLPPQASKTPPRNFCDLGDGSEARLLRSSILSENDSEIPKEVIDEIIDKEIAYNTERIKNLSEMLDDILNGTFAPTFPGIFGGENALISKTPEIIDELARVAVAGTFGPAINNFNSSILNYSDNWNLINDQGGSVSPSSAKDLYTWFDEISYTEESDGNKVKGLFSYGYDVDPLGQDGLELSAAQATSLGIGEGVAAYPGAENYYVFHNIDANFKRNGENGAALIETMNLAFGPQGFSSIALEQVLDFVEKMDDEGDGLTSSHLIYDPWNPLISFSVVTYREGGIGSWFTDVYEVMIVQTVYGEEDQETLGTITYDYGETFGAIDKDNLAEKLENNFSGDGTLSRDMKNAIIAYASNDMKEFQSILATAGVAGGVALFTAPIAGAVSGLLAGAAANAFIASGATAAAAHGTAMGVASSSKVLLSLSGAAGPLVIGAIALVAIVVLLILIFTDPPPRATRLVVPTESGDTVTYDVIADYPTGGKIKVIKRFVSAELMNTTKGTYPSNWPAKIVSLEKYSGFALDPAESVDGSVDMFDMSSVSLDPTDEETSKTDVKQYGKTFLFDTVAPRTGIKQSQTGLTLSSYTSNSTQYKYQVPSTGFIEQQSQTSAKYSAASEEFGNLVASAILEYFPTAPEATISDIANAVKSKYSKLESGQALYLLNNQLLFQTKELIRDNRFWQQDSFKDINLTYPATDIFGYENLADEIQEFSSQVLTLQNEDAYCDERSAVRRANASYSVRMLVRSYIIEQALISVQVIDQIEPLIMESDIFVDHIYNLIKEEAGLYRGSFSIENNIWTDIIADTATYYQIRQLLGEEIPTYARSKDYFRQLIREEIEQLIPRIGNSLDLQNSFSNWNNFLSNKLLGEYDAALSAAGYSQSGAESEEERTERRTEQTRRVSNQPLITPFLETTPADQLTYGQGAFANRVTNAVDLPDGFILEKYVKVKRKGASSYSIMGIESFKELFYDPIWFTMSFFDQWDYLYFGYRLIYVTDTQQVWSTGGSTHTGDPRLLYDALAQLDPYTSEYGGRFAYHPRSNQEKALIMNGQLVEDPNGGTADYWYVAIPLISVECEYKPTNAFGMQLEPTIGDVWRLFYSGGEYESDIYPKLKSDLTQSEEYDRILNLLVPFKDMFAGFMLYQYNALSDTGVFADFAESGNDDSLHNTMSKTKLSILQLLEASIYGNAKIVYRDPFTTKRRS
jgi:DNA-directed RNA polymerase subunit F